MLLRLPLKKEILVRVQNGELGIPRNYVFINDTRCKEIGYRQYVKRMYDPTRDRFLDIYKYRDSGDNMITD